MNVVDTIKAKIAEIEQSAAEELEALHAKLAEFEEHPSENLKKLLMWPVEEVKELIELVKHHV
jgi:translation elongation factor EF-Tu-like GTPase